ncbi:hypothetical protein DM611_07425 [Stenotrophomonas maltophilia]|nr:hypothetical protein DM611_07425 [Stenotrophomonas maltophilia]
MFCCCLILLWLLLVAGFVHAGFQPDHWQIRLGRSTTPTYPLQAVIGFSLLCLGELIVIASMLRPWSFSRLWLRLMIVLVPLLAWTLLWSVSAIHQPPVRGQHSQWLRLLSAGMLLALAIIALVQYWRRPGRQLNG